MVGAMKFLPKDDNQYFKFVLFLLLIFGYTHPYPASDNFTRKSEGLAKKNVPSHTVKSGVTSSHLAKNASKHCRVKQPTSKVSPGGRFKLRVIKSPADRNTVVVFDIDDAISYKFYLYEQGQFESHTECPRIWWTHKETGQKYLHIFLPYLEILFDYLIEHGARIVFFSAAIAERNLFVISELLESFWGRKKYEALKLGGQFYIYSKDDLTEKNNYGQYFKDLRKIIRNGEYLSDIILIDDDHTYTVKNQQPFIVVNMISLFSEDEDTSLNSIYYMLGLFKTYFESEIYKKLPIRDAMAHILPTNHPPSCRCQPDDRASPPFKKYIGCEKHPFLLDMIDIGLKAVQERVPNATLYIKTPYRWMLT